MSEQYTETVVIIRPSFKRITAKEEKTDACRAALFNHFLYWIARKAKGMSEQEVREGKVYWYATAEQIATEGLDQAWCTNKVRKEIDTLVAAQMVGQCHNPVKGWDQTKHYYLSEVEGANLKKKCDDLGICLLHLGLQPHVLHLLNMVNAIPKDGKCICQKDINAIPISGNAIPKVSTKVSTKVSPKKDTYDADASLPHVFSDDELLALLRERGYNITNQPDLSTFSLAGVDKSPEQVATRNPIATDIPQPTQHENGSQSELIARPEKPEMPPTSMKLSPLKLVLITEALIGEYYTQKQHPKQINAAKRIIAEGVDEEQYIAAYGDIRNWWKEHNGTLNVVDMAANTPRKQMRVLELVERVRTRGKPAPGKNLSLVPRSASIAEDYSAIGEVEQRQMNEFYAAHPELLVGA